MKLNILKPRQSLNKAFLKVKPNRTEIESFKQNLAKLIDHINEAETEEFHKNIVSTFLKDTYYKENHFINTKGRNDLVIHNGKDAKSTVGVIIEAKKPTNKAEMLKTDNINTKAFQELVLYYLRERITGKNLDVKYLIATNIYEWFIFDAQLFDKLFAHNKAFVNQFNDFEENRLSVNKTESFYKEIAEPYINEIKTEITFTYFDIRDFNSIIRNADKHDDSKLITLYKLLSPEHLLKLPFVNDSNSLDKRFYSELLHIIGLTETKESSKKLIERKKEGERNTGSLIENAIIQLDSLDKLSRLEKLYSFGETNKERLFNVALELAITWVNRILFLKLLEAQLISYHKGDKSYSFLNIEKVKNYDDLNNLFFQVLARIPSERNSEVKTVFAKVPYLNSSLFEPTPVEHSCLFISQLNNKKLPILSTTVLKDSTGKKRTGEIDSMEYFFEFLDAYDFTSEGQEEIQEDNKTLINASVLGLIFEKINGYKDGSFFTPSFITMYMCRETIRRAVVQKFNEVKGWECKTIDDLYNKIDDNAEANRIINSIKICDPAVGSGHFLVSALNEIIAVKSELRVLLDRNGKRLKEYHVEVENDELMITDEDGKFLEYNPRNPESQRVQETLFHEKQTIIESCLFGVDINPNSVKICRLRLWIELLKNAYYKESGELETLPNIDINIKCGNSLISRYALDADIKAALKRSKWSIDSYRIAVMSYRNAQTKDEKRAMERLIDQIKSDFVSEIAANDKRLIKLSKAKGELLTLTTQTTLFDRTKAEKAAWEKQVKALTETVKNLETELEEIRNSKIYENAFEWRFEFPEVLNDEGDFVGFDVVIGNPPYIPLESFNINERSYFNIKYSQLERKYESSVSFIIEGMQITGNSGLLSYIAPITWQTGENYIKFRSYFLTNFGVEKIINLPFNIFEDAYVDTALYFLSKKKKNQYLIYAFDKKAEVKTLENLDYQKFEVTDIKSPDFKLIIDESSKLFSRYNNDEFVVLGNITKSTQGLSGSSFPECSEELSDYNFPFLAKGNVYNYSLIKEKIYNTNLSDKKNLMQFYQDEPKILIRRIISRQNRLSVTFCNEKLVFKKDINPFIPTDSNFSSLYLTGILASKFISFIYLNSSSIATKDDFRQTTLSELRKLPIPKANMTKQKEIIELVSAILELKKQSASANTSMIETQIDQLVYQLYDLTEDEIKIIESC
ncbi:MAG: TaqI-like C-terminal specificity domain-containing protein [Tenuifilaceae bacterium]